MYSRSRFIFFLFLKERRKLDLLDSKWSTRSRLIKRKWRLWWHRGPCYFFLQHQRISFRGRIVRRARKIGAPCKRGETANRKEEKYRISRRSIARAVYPGNRAERAGASTLRAIASRQEGSWKDRTEGKQRARDMYREPNSSSGSNGSTKGDEVELVSRFLAPLCARDEAARNIALAAARTTVEGWLGSVSSPNRWEDASDIEDTKSATGKFSSQDGR